MCNTKVYFSFRQIFKDIQIREYTFQPNTIPACKKVFRRASPVTMQKHSLIKIEIGDYGQEASDGKRV
jgi:hypothetical protein